MSDARMREGRGDGCNFCSWKKKKKNALACNCQEFIRAQEISRDKGRQSPTLKDT